MTKNVQNKLLLICLIFSYCIGSIVSPIYADNADYDFSELLEQRQSSYDSNQSTVKISDFTDVKESDWFYGNLKFLVENNLINGKTESTFEPYGSFSYAECSAIIVRYLGLQDEAQKRQLQITERIPQAKNLWYAGYFEVLGNLGLFLDYNVFEFENGKITSIDNILSNAPIERYKFAESISKSFETSGNIKAKNVFSEYGGCGREFIVSGMYNRDILKQYENEILDFDDIPQQSKDYVLKAYYNGIFSGDVSGNFYPHYDLTRAEMAKVLSCICDFNLRTRLIDDSYGQKLTQDMLHTDSVGVKTLDYDVWAELLENEAKSLSVSAGCLEYVPTGNAPFGYAIDTYVYTMSGEKYILSGEWSMRERSGSMLSLKGDSFKVLMVIRNQTQGSRPEGVYKIMISDGVITSAEPNIRQM